MAVGPIRDLKKIRAVRLYLKGKNLTYHAMFVVGINVALRIGDLLTLTWDDLMYDNYKKFKEFEITESKTKKKRKIRLNKPAQDAILELKASLEEFNPADPILLSRQSKDNDSRGKSKAMSRQQAFRIIKEACEACGVNEKIGTHSLRKTWAYQAWKSGASPALIMETIGHSSWAQTRLYAGIRQYEINDLYDQITLS